MAGRSSAGRMTGARDCSDYSAQSFPDAVNPSWRTAGDCRSADSDRIAADFAAKAGGPRCDFDSAADSDAAVYSRSDSARADDCRRYSASTAGTAGAAAATGAAAADQDARFVQTQLQPTVRSRAL